VTNDELTTRIRADLLEMEARIVASNHPKRPRLRRLAMAAHSALWELFTHLTESGDVSIESGGEPKE